MRGILLSCGGLRWEKRKVCGAGKPGRTAGILDADFLAASRPVGIRTGEIKYLTWAKVDWKTGFIRLRAEDTKKGGPRTFRSHRSCRKY